MRKTLTLAVLLLAMVLMVSACGSTVNPTAGRPESTQTEGSQPGGDEGGSSDEASTFERLQEQGYVRVGFANEAPWAYATPDGQLTGVAVETARAIFAELGIEEVNGVLAEWNSLIPGLQAGRFDVITASMAILPDRCERVDFSNPDIKYGEALAVQPGNPYNLKSYEDIAANPDVKVGVMAGASEYDFMLEAGVSESQITVASDQPSLFSMLRSGQIDAITMTTGSLSVLMSSLDDPSVIERVEDFQQPIVDGEPFISYGGAAFRPDDDAFREAWNEQLEKIKSSGELERIHARFGFGRDAWPGNMTAEEQCGG